MSSLQFSRIFVVPLLAVSGISLRAQPASAISRASAAVAANTPVQTAGPAQAQAPLAAPAAATAKPGPVNIVVFSDFECPFSAQMFFTLEGLEKMYPGQFRVTYKQSPLPIHPDAPLAHKAALAAGRQGRYAEMAELLYANQSRQGPDAVLGYARQIHLDLARFRRDLNSAVVAAELQKDMDESEAFGVEQTPLLYVNGHSLVGVQPQGTLAALIQQKSAERTAAANAVPASEMRLDPALTAQLAALPLASTGANDAPLTIVEFTDFQCPFCRAAVEPMEQFMAARGRQVRWVFRAFPLEFHPDSELATEAALAAGEQGKFWPMHDLLFKHQDALKQDDLRRYAQSLELDMARFDEALATHRFAGQIAADRALGMKAGVDGTPTFIVNGQAYDGARSLPELNQIADAHLQGGNAAATLGLAASVPEVTVLPDQQVLGGSAAVPVTLTWYVDVRSPLAERQAQLVQHLALAYVGKVRVLFRAYALDAHPDGKLAGAALIAALQQDSFWKMYEAIAVRRDVLDRAKIVTMAETLGMNVKSFGAAFDAAASDVSQDMTEATRRGIQGAPVIFINEQRLDGLQPESHYTAVVERELKSAPVVQASAK